jgi:hypothetical protein
MKNSFAPSFALLAACAAAPLETPDRDSSEVSKDSSADLSGRGEHPQVLTAIAIQTDVPPQMVLYREGTGPWLPAQRLKATTYEAMVSGPYTVLVVCPLENGPYSSLTSQTLQDELLVQNYCAFEDLPVQVTGTVVQPGMVNLSNSFQLSRVPGWSYSLPTYRGVHDLVAASADHLLIMRDLTVNDDLALPPLDLAQQGVALVTAPVTVTNPFPGEILSGAAFLRTPGASQSIIYRGPLPARLPPGSALGRRDRLDLSVRSQIREGNYFTFRAARRQVFNASPTPVTQWDPIVNLQMGTGASGDSAASWTSLQPHDWLSYVAYDDLGVTMDHLMSSSYLAATGGHQVVLATDAPGFGDEWRLDLSSYTRSFLVIREGATRYSYQHEEYDSQLAATEASALRDRALARRRLGAD